MTPQQLLTKIEKVKPQKIGKEPVVVLPLADWRKIEAMLEDYEMSRSLDYRRSIEESRAQAKLDKLHEFDLKTGAFKKTRKR